MRSNAERPHRALAIATGVVAIAAPALHTLSDALEWQRGGFSTEQLWLNYAAFVPMPWLLLGLWAVQAPRPGATGLVGAILYGAAFAYFSHTTLYALAERVPTYEALWSRLGAAYTAHGVVMIAGGLMFAWSAWRAACLPRAAVGLFAAGLLLNLLLGLLPAPEILQVFGTALRNAGLVAMGVAVLRARPRPASAATGAPG